MSASPAFALCLAIRVFAALLFLRAATLKFRSRASFEGVLENYEILPRAVTRPVAALLPALEALIAAALVAPPMQPWAGLAAAVLLALFALAMGVNLARGRNHIGCGCADTSADQPIGPGLVVRNLVLAGLLVAAALTPVGPASLGAVVVALAAAAAAFMLYLCQEAFAALPQRQKGAAL